MERWDGRFLVVVPERAERGEWVVIGGGVEKLKSLTALRVYLLAVDLRAGY